ncbi:hypothetical protein [Pseudomonas aeruginosa]|uniref:hypothetical protein n=1 Tax=Pseudomonas aeruginosa TaxID=287 RepID=UPI0024AF719E|nr:hypothetical protein [Pseudomonas aeruginosa]MDI7005143.1 hypothetical protein [Pseudomonas aeruginosa]
MTTYATGNPLGSKDPRDLYDNSENLDAAMNDRVNTTWNDRFGVSRKTWFGVEQQVNDFLANSGFELPPLVYVDGSTLTVDRPTQLIERDGNPYSVKLPASFPVQLTGNWATDQELLVAQVDRPLRQELADATDPAKGAGLVGYKGRAVSERLNDIQSVLDFYADGSPNFGDAFTMAHAEAPAGVSIIVPAGVYDLGGAIIETPLRRWLFDGASLINGKLNGAIIVSTSADGGVNFGGGVGSAAFSSQTRYRFGRTLGNMAATGLQVGGGNQDEGSDGTQLYLDSYSGWMVAQNSKYPGPQELAVQPRPAAGSASFTAGGNVVTAAVPLFSAAFVDKRIYLGDLIYLISEYISPTQVRVKNLNNSVVSFGSSSTVTCIVCYAGGSGVCNTSGTSVTRVSGDPFVPTTNTEYKIKIGATTYTVNGFTDPDTVTLATSAGTQTGVAYEWWTSVDNLSSALRVHRVASAGFEENVTLSAHANGYFRLQALGSGGAFPHRQYPLFIGSGYIPSGAQRAQITLDGTNGDTLLGGGFDRFSVRIASREGNPGNAIYMGGANAGAPAFISTEGTDAHIDLQLMPKGDGKVWLGPTISGTTTPDHVMFVKNRAGQTFQIPCKLVP